MNLYLISQTENVNADTYDSAVVCAKDMDTARNMNPSTGTPMRWHGTPSSLVISAWCKSVDKVQVDLIGQAVDGLKQGVICSSFNAGYV